MSLLSGSTSITRYRYVDSQPFTLRRLNNALDQYKAEPISLKGSTTKEKIGWISSELYPSESHDVWDASSCEVEDGFLLTFRVEKKQVPGQLLQHLLKQALAKSKPKNRAEKQELKETLELKLLAQTLPTVKELQCFLPSEEGEVLLFAAGRSNCDHFERLFARTFIKKFGGILLPVLPPLLAFSEKEWQSGSDERDVLVEGMVDTSPNSSWTRPYSE